ncbi:N-acetyltransferase [Agrobacterium sp. OT33]|uniref:N-acetyltransferase n=1 Tax=Agrobacterium sp. OT33 TaxID=2815338 RepID=UPI001A901DCC|nr:N-acetyltransferase [Agrobacterium sp. OT33]MBO0125126.1 N-acetyltransferase [Agrobacterium sp. OT33]
MRFTWGLAEKGEQTDRLAFLVADKIWPGRGFDFGHCRGIAVVKGDELAAGIIYHNYEPDAEVLEISAAAFMPGWMTRHTLQAMFDYPFISCGCQAVVHRVPDDDTAQHRMLTSYGHVRYRIPRLRGRDKADNIFVLTHEAWAGNAFNKRRFSNGQK